MVNIFKYSLNDLIYIILNLSERKCCEHGHRPKKCIMNEDSNIIQMSSTSVILLIFMSDIFFLYMNDERCFTFIIHYIHYFVWFTTLINSHLKIKYEKYCYTLQGH